MPPTKTSLVTQNQRLKELLYAVQAIDRGEGSGDDWAEFQQRLKQAESDATTFNSAKRQALEAKQVPLAYVQQLPRL